jgi:hypothetical protein
MFILLFPGASGEIRPQQQPMDFVGAYMEPLPHALEPPPSASSSSNNAPHDHHQQQSQGGSMSNSNNNAMHHHSSSHSRKQSEGGQIELSLERQLQALAQRGPHQQQQQQQSPYHHHEMSSPSTFGQHPQQHQQHPSSPVYHPVSPMHHPVSPMHSYVLCRHLCTRRLRRMRLVRIGDIRCSRINFNNNTQTYT